MIVMREYVHYGAVPISNQLMTEMYIYSEQTTVLRIQQ